MGCDIHVIIQKCDPKDEKPHWQTVVYGSTWDRWYAFFSVLADVRSGRELFEPIAAGRGIPEDFHLWDCYDVGYHSQSWCTSDELERATKEVPHADAIAALAMMRSYESQGYKTRMVFGFDS